MKLSKVLGLMVAVLAVPWVVTGCSAPAAISGEDGRDEHETRAVARGEGVPQTINERVNEDARPAPIDATRVTRVTVVEVIDGDTVRVRREAGAPLPSDRVRLIGVDTPEVRPPAEPFGREARRFARERLQGRTVWLERDVSETDRYGRALRYAWLSEPPGHPAERDVRHKMFNAILLLEGYARVVTLPPDVRYTDWFVRFQREARKAGRGLWGTP
ncbi:MAG TPA: thermonuclease family protein [Thermaerobacter sp.]